MAGGYAGSGAVVDGEIASAEDVEEVFAQGFELSLGTDVVEGGVAVALEPALSARDPRPPVGKQWMAWPFESS